MLDYKEKIKSIDSDMKSTASTNIQEDAVSQVLGRDKYGRLRGMGRGVTPTKVAFMKARDAHVQKLEATQTELIKTIKDLQTEVRDLAKGKVQSEDVCMSEASNVSKVGIRCRLLDWGSVDDVVVGEGELCSVEPMYKIAHIPLGPNAAAVIVTSVSNEDAFLWRPTTKMHSLGQAVGTKIAWPADKIMLDTEMNSPNDNTSAGSSALLDRVTIYDWHSEDVVVAEGRFYSCDPTEMVNNIPLGPNAAILKVEKVVVKDCYLWRPISSEQYLMGDALHEFIVWPISKILVSSPARQPSPKAVPQTSVSGSMDKSNSNQQKKCQLLDVNNSGDVVAEGTISSTNPEDKIHFVPLGPNASKVWVQVVKIGTAEVWRPNSEIEFISDALGTTVAWPNDKLVIM